MSRVAGVILAAGASRRLGEPKQLALLAGETLVRRAVRVAGGARCEPVVVVLGAGAVEVRGQCSGARVVVNEGWAEGMGSSIRVGVGEVAGEVEGVIVMTCDQPAVGSDHLRRLAGRDVDAITGSGYGGRVGVPAYFPTRYFSELLSLAGDQGARELLAGAAAVELPGGELDVDTPERLAAARAIYGA